MGIIADYYALSDDELHQCREILQSEDRGKGWFDFQKYVSDNFYSTDNTVYLDKFWDGLHFLLTGYASYNDDPSNKSFEQIVLYDGFFGQMDVADKLDVSVRYISKFRVADIVKALEGMNIDELLKEADFNAFNEADIYPNFWHNIDDDMIGGLKDLFEKFKQFYQTALKNNRSVLITIC